MIIFAEILIILGMILTSGAIFLFVNNQHMLDDFQTKIAEVELKMIEKENQLSAKIDKYQIEKTNLLQQIIDKLLK